MKKESKENTQSLANEVAFYRSKNFGGAGEFYNVYNDVTFWQGDNFNDKYLSLRVIGNVNVHCYQHSYGTGIYKVYKQGDHPDISEMGGLSKFWIAPAGSDGGGDELPDWSIALRLVDDVLNENNEPGRYKGRFAAAGLGTVSPVSESPDISDQDARYSLLTGKGNTIDINCGIDIFYIKTNALVASGQIIFTYNTSTGSVSITSQTITNILVDTKIEAKDNTRYDIKLSVKDGISPPGEGYMNIYRAVWNGTSMFNVSGRGTPGAQATIWTRHPNGMGEKIADVDNGGNWLYEGGRPRYGFVQEGYYDDGKPRFTLTVEQKVAAPTIDKSDVLYAAPDIIYPLWGEMLHNPLPEFYGSAYYHPSYKPMVLISDGRGNELGRTEVAPDGSWRLTPEIELPPGNYDLTAEIIFHDSIPINRQFKSETIEIMISVTE
ncbi:hypothetical protein HCO69_22330 [Pantoea sp. LS15]|uniref:beta/gamma crystallin domain-containing protein n=1 Tax=Enterobacterales TaxID=91347 RepID=UPI000E0EA184|nr:MULTISPECIES: beta/gamma crystallin domain-containing protein [Enterobacterales]NJQ22342.1 hypothetical protein [Pantoea sp. LS15]NKF48938.1 hypothetical protein [Pantoea sp. LS15]RDK12387.1 hypothetical protein CEJ32_22930 [Enterobacter sp. 9-2]